MDRSRNTETKYQKFETTQKAINGKLFKRLNNLSKDLYKVEYKKSDIEHRESIIVSSFIPQYAKIHMLESYYNFFDRVFKCENI